MKRKLLYSLLLISVLVSCGNQQSSSSNNDLSSSESSVDKRTAKEKVLDVCDIIIENSKDRTLIASSQVVNGKVSLSNLNSTTYIYQKTDFTLDNLKVFTQSEIDDEESKSLYHVEGKYNVNHIEEYLGEEELEDELNNYTSEVTLNEKIMLLGDDFYSDFSSSFDDYFSSDAKEASKDLQFKQIDLGKIISDTIKEEYPDLDTSNVEIPEINPNELLDEFIGDDSLFNEYLKYEDKNGLKLILELKPADFNELINELLLEYDPESTLPISTMVQMDTGNITLTFNFSENDIEKVDISINGTFNILVDQYNLNIKLDGSLVNEEIDSFDYLENYQNYVELSQVGIDIGKELKDILGNLNFDIEENIPEI